MRDVALWSGTSVFELLLLKLTIWRVSTKISLAVGILLQRHDVDTAYGVSTIWVFLVF